MVHHALESRILLGVRQDHQPEIFLRHQKHSRNKSRNAAGVADELSSAVIPQEPAVAVSAKMWVQGLQFLSSPVQSV